MKKKSKPLASALIGFLLLATTMLIPRVSAQDAGQASQRPRPPRRDAAWNSLPPEVAALKKLSIILGRPTDKSVTANVLSADALEGYIEYGIKPGKYSHKTGTITFTAGKPVEVTLDQLKQDKQVWYRFRYRKPSEKDFTHGAEHSFHTQRAPGSAFTFEIQGDSHPERPQMFDPALYAQTLSMAASDHPDFYMTIGDDFSVDAIKARRPDFYSALSHDSNTDAMRMVNAESIAERYLLQRPFLGIVAQDSPLFLVNGNHEQASAANLNDSPNNVAVWAQNDRNSLFPMPAPDGFYTGDEQPVKYIGPLRDYYAWTWGDATFIVIDFYWHSPVSVDEPFGGGPRTRDLWQVTLGDTQYKWLKKTLETSKSKYKFLFAHHILGTGRGGIEEAGLFEWGGRNRRGDYQFAEKRPGWAMPIHQLMAKNGVTIFFQGHDHIFAKQRLDGVIYQSLPMPADPYYAYQNAASYLTGDKLPSSGRVRVTVSPEKVKVEYIRSWLPKEVSTNRRNGELGYSYEVSGSGDDRRNIPSH